MSETYSVVQYMMPGIYLIIGMLMMALVVAILGVRLTKRYQRVWVGLIPVAMWLCVVLATGPVFVDSMEPTDDLYPNHGYEIRKTAGVLEQITPACRNWVCRTDYWIIDGQQFYVLSGSTAEEGMYVLVEYATVEDHVILGWQESDPDTAETVLQEQAKADLLPEPEPPGLPMWRTALGDILIKIGMLGALVSIVLMNLFREKITFWLSERDMTGQRGITRDPVGTLIMIGPMLFILLILVGDSVAGNSSFLFMLILFVGLAGFFTLRSFPWGMKVDGQHITVWRWCRERNYTIKDIAVLRYRPVKGFAGRTMEVVFCDGEVWEFDVDSHLGVQYTYLYLQERMKKH